MTTPWPFGTDADEHDPQVARPHRHDPTDVLKAALARTSADARRYAQTGPKAHEDACGKSGYLACGRVEPGIPVL